MGVTIILNVLYIYLAIGMVLAFIGPAARQLRKETANVGNATPGWKSFAFSLVIGLAIVALWPILVPSAWSKERQDKQRSENSIFGMLNALAEQGTDQDMLPNGYGEFGLVSTNPIPTRTIMGSARYLARLRTQDGEEVTHMRIGSKLDPVSESPIDVYEVRSLENDLLATIYISPYNKKNSSLAPRGFRIGR